MAKELNRLQIFVLAKLVWHPLSRLLSIVQIQHGCHRIHTQSIHMIMLNPEQSASDQEIFDLCLAIIKNLCSPLRMLASAYS